MNAIILAGGFGSRLKPLTNNLPKPMLPLANMPMIDYTISHLESFGVKDYVFTLSYMPEKIIEWAIGYRDTVCHFSIESEPLGTLGGVKACENLLDDTFIVSSGDALEDIDFGVMLDKHRKSKSLVTMAVKEVSDPSKYGVVEIDKSGRVAGFCEKPPLGMQKSNLINCGVYIVEKSVLDMIMPNVKVDFSLDLFPTLVEMGKLSVHIHEGYWCDIGDIKSYYDANFYCVDNVFFKKANNYKRNEMVSIKTGGDKKSYVSLSSNIVGKITQSIVGHNCAIASGASIENCIVLDNCIVKSKHRNAIIGSDFVINIDNDSVEFLEFERKQENIYKYS